MAAIDKNNNTIQNPEVQKEEYDNEIKRERTKRQNRNIPRLLMYAAATLSFISFLTTADGMTAVIGKDDLWKAYFISFGIQAIVLILGTRFFKVWEIIKKSNEKKEVTTPRRNGVFNMFVRALMVVLYFCSIAFSSFFSFVFLANHAYDEVKPSDYNIAIEQFLVSETKNLKDINDATGRVMLAEIQRNAPKFNSLISEFKTSASTDLKKIISNANLTKNETTSIPKERRFNAQTIIDRYGPNDAQIQMIREHESKINAVADGYETSYSSYSTLYEELQSFSDPNLADQRSSRIDSEIKTLNSYIESLSNINDTLSWINTPLQQAKSSITIELNTLIKSYNDLKVVYDQIKEADLTTEANISLQRIYETIYSPENVAEEDVDNAITDLKTIITEYLKTSETIDNEVVQSVSACITYLGEFKKYQGLDNGLADFERNTLNQVYIINQNSESVTPEKLGDLNLESSNDEDVSKSTSVSTSNTDSENIILYNEVTYDEWKKLRREDMAQFIRLLKTLPDVKLLVQTIENTNSTSTTELNELQSYNDYVNATLTKAYDLNRRTLENINEVERACKFLTSEYKFMAIFCSLIAFFMDFASFLIGIFLFYNDKDKPQKIASTKQETPNPVI